MSLEAFIIQQITDSHTVNLLFGLQNYEIFLK